MRLETDASAKTMRMEQLAQTLPKDADDPTGEKLARLVAQIAGRKVPVSSFVRIWTLGSAQAEVALGYLAYWFRSRFADEDEKERLKNEAHLAAALKLFGTMGYLRGAVMKVGQLLASLPELLPEQFAEVLSGLHFQAPPMHFAMVREVFLNEFGREPEEVFAFFDRTAFAAASLGQVHRARLHSGEEVAVKIQYPGIARTISSDLRSLRLLIQPMTFGPDRRDLLAKLAEIEQMLEMEADYLQEASFMRQARPLFTEGERIVVPRVFDDYSSRRVLTTEFLHGCHLDQFLASNPSQQVKDRLAADYTRSTFRIYYRLRWLTADPHPGNLIFMDDGRLGLIDFGCTKAMNDEEWRLSSEQIEASLQGDDERMNRIIAQACQFGAPEKMEPERLEMLRQSFLWFMEPWLYDGVFDFGDRDFFRRGMEHLMALGRKGYTRSIPFAIWSHRFTMVARAVALRLGGRCEFRKIFLEEADAAGSTQASVPARHTAAR